MAGLLDFIAGDSVTQDESGQTESQRRLPIWAGLIKAGLLAHAGGGYLMPEDRAKYYAEAGGALAGIPNDMMQAAQGAAQNKLKAQQISEGKQKLVDRDQVRAMANTPEVQAALAKASGPDKLAIIMALKTGDIHALTTAVGNLDKSGLNADRLQLATDKFNFAKEQKDKQTGGMAGTGERQQLYTWLMSEPPDSQKYALAHNYFGKEQRYVENGQTVVQPPMDLEGLGYGKPTWRGPAAAPPASPAPAPGQTTTLPNGNTLETSADGKTVTETDPKSGTQTIRQEGQPPKTVAAKPPDHQEVAKFHTAEAEGKAIIEGLENFRRLSRNASPVDRAKSVAGFSTGLNTSYGITTMLAKGEALFNLGVLNGQDLEVLRRILPDPSTFKGTLSDADEAIDQVTKLINFRLKIKEQQIYPRGRPTTPQAGGGPKADKVWNPATQSFD
jgi:hypothetical protein